MEKADVDYFKSIAMWLIANAKQLEIKLNDKTLELDRIDMILASMKSDISTMERIIDNSLDS